MENEILNLQQAMDFLGVSEKTMIKLLREEHIPARKIGREWRFSRTALIAWLATGDSLNYINQNELYMICQDTPGNSNDLFENIRETLTKITELDYNIKCVFKNLEKDIIIPENATLRISYKQQREIEKLEFKIFWDLRQDSKLETNQKLIPSH